MPAFDLGKHDLIDIEHLVDDPDIFAGLLLVPSGKFGQDILVDIVCPIVDFQRQLAIIVISLFISCFSPLAFGLLRPFINHNQKDKHRHENDS